MRCAAVSACRRSRPRRSTTNSRRSRHGCCPIWTRCGRCSTRSGARASASCSKARRARCSTSTTALIRSSRPPTRWRRRRRPARGLVPRAIGYVLGICKAYTTRVGEGPFPTEQTNEIGRLIGERGREFGTVTGRPRRCGWFDAVLVRQTVRTSGINGLALTKLDILDGLNEIKVCVGIPSGRAGDRLSARRRACAGQGRADLRDGRRLAGADGAGALLGGAAGAGHQICAPDRGTGGMPGCLAVDQSRT